MKRNNVLMAIATMIFVFPCVEEAAAGVQGFRHDFDQFQRQIGTEVNNQLGQMNSEIKRYAFPQQEETRVVSDGQGGFKTQKLVYRMTGNGNTIPVWQDVENQARRAPNPETDRTRTIPDGRGGFVTQKLVTEELPNGRSQAVWVVVDSSSRNANNIPRPRRDNDIVFQKPGWVNPGPITGYSVSSDPSPEPDCARTAIQQLGHAFQLVHVHYWGHRVLGPGYRGPEKLVCEVRNRKTGQNEFWDLLLHPGQGQDWRLTSSSRLPVVSANPPSVRDAYQASRRSSGNGVNVRFQNPNNETIEVFWVDSLGREQHYGELATGQVHEQGTYPGDLWRFKTKQGQVVANYRAIESTTYSIRATGFIPPRPTPRSRQPGYQRPGWTNPPAQPLLGGISIADANSPEMRFRAQRAVELNGNRFGNDSSARQLRQVLHAGVQVLYPDSNYYFVLKMADGKIWDVKFSGGDTVVFKPLN